MNSQATSERLLLLAKQHGLLKELVCFGGLSGCNGVCLRADQLLQLVLEAMMDDTDQWTEQWVELPHLLPFIEVTCYSHLM